MRRVPTVLLPLLVGIVGGACTRLEPFQCPPEATCVADGAGAGDAAVAPDGPPVDAGPPRCGDGEIREHVEECDPPGGDCSSACLRCASPGVAAADGHCWELLGIGSYTAAHAACVGRAGGHVATPNSAEEVGGPLAAIQALADDALIFIGLSDTRTEGTWAYATGEAPIDIPWAASEPNGGTDENCVMVGGGGWVDVPCERPERAVCERDPPAVRLPGRAAYRRDFAARDAFAAAGGCPFGGGPAILADADELAFVRAILPSGADCAWVGGSVGLDGVLQWIAPGGASSLPWGPGEPSQIGCLCVGPGGLGVRGCDNVRETICEIDP